MKTVYTQEMFDALPVVDGVRQCPTGDYTQVREFGPQCTFGPHCTFAPRCKFGTQCTFGYCCTFSNYCTFGTSCTFGPRCMFGTSCMLGPSCKFGSYCTFGNYCMFGTSCKFGTACTFEDTVQVQDGYPFLTFGGGGSANRTVYFYNTPEVHVRAGCFFGTLEAFRAKVLVDDPNAATAPSVKTRQYLGMADIAALTFLK